MSQKRQSTRFPSAASPVSASSVTKRTPKIRLVTDFLAPQHLAQKDHWLRCVLMDMRLVRGSPVGRSIAYAAARSNVEASEDRSTALRGFLHLMEATDSPALIVDRTHAGQRLRYANEAVKRLLDCERSDLAARVWSFLFSPTCVKSNLSRVRAMMDLGLPVNETLRAEHRTGVVLWLETRMYPVRDARGVVTQYVGTLRDVTHERRSRDELEYRAYHDALTGLANRHLLQERFEQARAHAERWSGALAVVVVDMNGFKLINDRFGHQAGDTLLRCVGARLSSAVRAEDTVARLGGDEFVLLLGEEPGAGDARAVIGRVAGALARPIMLEKQHLVLACCAGVSRFPTDGAELESLLKAADVALYRAKARAMTCWVQPRAHC